MAFSYLVLSCYESQSDIHWSVHISYTQQKRYGSKCAIFNVVAEFNISRPRQNGCHFRDYIFKSNFLNENIWILLKVSLKFVPKGPINNNPAFVQIMAWRRPGDKSLSELMIVTLLMHICITRPQRVQVGTEYRFYDIIIYCTTVLHITTCIFKRRLVISSLIWHKYVGVQLHYPG